jgi:D-lactate dehydrogenase (cytochrome)
MGSAGHLPRNEEGITAALGVLKQQFGEAFQTGQSIREQHGHTTTWIETQAPDAVVFAKSTEEVASIVKVCATHKVPVIAYGTGTSLEGHVNAPAGGVCIDLTEMNTINFGQHRHPCGTSCAMRSASGAVIVCISVFGAPEAVI